MYYGSFADRISEENRQLKKKIEIYESGNAIAEIKSLCDRRVKGAVDREKKNYESWMNTLNAYKDLKSKYSTMSNEHQKFKRENRILRNRNESLEKDYERLHRMINDVQDERDCARAVIIEKDKEIAALKEELLKLRAQLDHDGTTNGIPTSQTPRDKKKVIPNTREKSEKKKGGQPGHEKKCMEAFDDEEVTETEEHTLATCPGCGGELEELGNDETVIKDEADYEVRIIKKRHRFKKYRCKNCGKTVRAPIPKRLKEKNQYGPAVQAMALALVDLGFVSVSRAQDIATGILHRKLAPSEGFVGKVQKKASRMLKSFLEEAKGLCLKQRILHWDDTVIFMNTTRACMRFYGNEKVSYYAAHASKDAKGIEEDGILSALTEKTYLMHDHVKYNYRKEFLFKNIECIQHMERELENVFRASGHEWAKEMKELIKEAIHLRKEYQKAGLTSFTSAETNSFEEKLENLIIQAHRQQSADEGRYYSTDEMNAIRKLEEYRWNYFAWIYDFSLPATNNVAESGLRMTKAKQKVSGQFVKEETAQEFAAVRTYTDTCRKNGINEYEALERLMAGNPYTLAEIIGDEK